jgi:WD40 repeat protein
VAFPSAAVIRRFIGASPESSGGLMLLRSLSQQIGEAYGATGELPADFNGAAREFRERLALATEERPLLIFLDALDQLGKDDPAGAFGWLGGQLPSHCRVVVSTTDVAPNECVLLELKILPRADAATALDHWLREARRRLQPAQRVRLLEAFAPCGLPLYLKLAFEEARGWPSYLPADQCRLGRGVEGIIDTLLSRLSEQSHHGPLLVNRGLGYLAAARYGLTEGEILDLLSGDEELWQDFERRAHHTPPERRLPVIVWSRLFLDLEPYLAERSVPGGTVASFYHRQLAEQATARFLAGEQDRGRHRPLAAYFAGRANWLDEGKTQANARKAAELPYQQRASGLWREAEATLLDCPLLLAKCASNLVLDLDADYRALLTEAPPGSLEKRDELDLIHEALRLSMHVVAPHPQQFAPQMVGRLLAYGDNPAIRRFYDGVAAVASVPWVRPLHPALHPPGTALVLTLEGHASPVRGVAVAPDGKRAVSAARDGTLKVWDLETGACLRALEGHTAPVGGVAMTPDGKRAVSASRDRTLKVWDLETGACLLTLEGHTAPVDGVAVTPDGKRAVSVSRDGTLRVWDLETGDLVRTLAGGVASVAISPDGKRAVSVCNDPTQRVLDLGRGKKAVTTYYNRTLKLWDLETGGALLALEGHSRTGTGVVFGVAMTPDGKHAVSASDDYTLKLWDLESGRAMLTLEGHSDSVNAVAVTPDGRRAISASSDRTLKVWDLITGLELGTLEGHTNIVNAVAVTPDGRRAVSASEDDTLKVWNLATGRTLRPPEGHSDWVRGMAVTPDGKRAVSASSDKTLKVWDLETGRALRTLKGHSGDVWSVAVTPDGKRAVSASDDRTLKVWDLMTGRVLRTLKGHSRPVYYVKVTADGKRAVSESADQSQKEWDLKTGRELGTLHRYLGSLSNKAMTPDDKQELSGHDDGTLTLWDRQTGQVVRTLKGHSGSVVGVALTPDGKEAVSTSLDHTLRVWDLETGRALATFYCDADARCCAVAANWTIVAGDSTGRVYFLRLEGQPARPTPHNPTAPVSQRKLALSHLLALIKEAWRG